MSSKLNRSDCIGELVLLRADHEEFDTEKQTIAEFASTSTITEPTFTIYNYYALITRIKQYNKHHKTNPFRYPKRELIIRMPNCKVYQEYQLLTTVVDQEKIIKSVNWRYSKAGLMEETAICSFDPKYADPIKIEQLKRFLRNQYTI